MPGEALRGLRVLEIGDSLPVAYCGRQFALWGADVAIVEGAAGSPLRRSARLASAAHRSSWEYVAAGKRAVAETAPERLFDLASRADILILDERARALIGCSHEVLRGAAPDLTVVSKSLPWSGDGPVGRLGGVGPHRSGPGLRGYLEPRQRLRADPAPFAGAAGHILAYACGVNAFVAALASLVGRLDGGRGQAVQVSELETIAAILPFLRVELTGADPRREGGPGSGVRVFQCRDGHVSFMPPTPAQLGRPTGLCWGSPTTNGRRSMTAHPRLERRASACWRCSTAGPPTRPSRRCSSASCNGASSVDGSPRRTPIWWPMTTSPPARFFHPRIEHLALGGAGHARRGWSPVCGRPPPRPRPAPPEAAKRPGTIGWSGSPVWRLRG